LEHVKKIQADSVKQKMKTLDLAKKSIDYLPEIKVIIRNQGKDLSKPVNPE
jgi:hypothetical protein